MINKEALQAAQGEFDSNPDIIGSLIYEICGLAAQVRTTFAPSQVDRELAEELEAARQADGALRLLHLRAVRARFMARLNEAPSEESPPATTATRLDEPAAERDASDWLLRNNAGLVDAIAAMRGALDQIGECLGAVQDDDGVDTLLTRFEAALRAARSQVRQERRDLADRRTPLPSARSAAA